MSDSSPAPVTFITGTDTGVGKTLITALLLAHLQPEYPDVGVIKPFCTGSRDDVRLFRRLMTDPPADSTLNPFFYDEPLAPWAAMKRSGDRVPFQVVCDHLRSTMARSCPLLIEGVGGLMVPLGPDYRVSDLIRHLQCRVIVVAPNRLGVLNQTLLTMHALRPLTPYEPRVVLMSTEENDLSSETNREMLDELLTPAPVYSYPFFGKNASTPERIREIEKNLKKSLADLVSPNTL